MYSSQGLVDGRGPFTWFRRQSQRDPGTYSCTWPVLFLVLQRCGLAHGVCKRPFRDLNPDLKSIWRIWLDPLPEGFGAERASFSAEWLWLRRTHLYIEAGVWLGSQALSWLRNCACNKTLHCFLSYSMACGVSSLAQQWSLVVVNSQKYSIVDPAVWRWSNGRVEFVVVI